LSKVTLPGEPSHPELPLCWCDWLRISPIGFRPTKTFMT